jgi:hypothetical protein
MNAELYAYICPIMRRNRADCWYIRVSTETFESAAGVGGACSCLPRRQDRRFSQPTATVHELDIYGSMSRYMGAAIT